MTIVFHPAAKKKGLATAIALLVGVLGGGMAVTISQPLITAALLGLVIYSVAPFYVPTTFEFTAESMKVTRFGKTKEFLWNNYRSYSLERNGFVIWINPDGPSKDKPLKTQIANIKGSVFFPLDKEGIQQAEPTLKKHLVFTK